MLAGAIFDMDGLMFDTEQIWQKNWKLIADEMGVDLAEEFKFNICGTNGALMNAVIEKYYHVEDGAPIAADCKRRVHDDLLESCPEKPGVHEILEFLKKNGVRIAVASSSTPEQIRRNLKNTNTEHLVDAVVSGSQVAHGKPAPDIFLKAAEEIGLPASECYVFEDAFNGVRAGYASGAKTIMIPDLSQPDDEMRRIASVYPSLIEAMEAIEKGEV